MALTKIDIVDKIADQLSFTKKEASDYFESTISILKQSLTDGKDVKLSGFGRFEVKQKKDRIGRNPQTGETIAIEARRIIGFKTSHLLRDRINESTA